jgi:hypothetical protein
MYYMACPECKEPIVRVKRIITARNEYAFYRAFPATEIHRPVPPEVTNPYKRDFEEAVAVLPLSPKASAALSRRNLQAILKDKAGAKKKTLEAQIDEVISAGGLPSHISEDLHAVRNIGNFAAHPIKSTETGMIVDVEPGEAEWNLDTIESLFDFYFVGPARAAKRRANLDVKLKAAKKPQLSERTTKPKEPQANPSV